MILYGVAGLERGRGGSGALGAVDEDGHRRTVLLSHSVTFHDADGRPITVTSQRPADDEKFASIRDWAPTATYMATAEGRRSIKTNPETAQRTRPLEVEWLPARIQVDGRAVAFEVCYFDQDWWAAVGRAPDAVVTIDSRGVPLTEVDLEHIPQYPVKPLPDLGEIGGRVQEDLQSRLERLPVRRVRSMSDYRELLSVEADHVQKLARRYGLSDHDCDAVRAYWLSRVPAELAETVEPFRFEHIGAVRDSRIGRRLRGHNVIFQLWFNTLGPGAKTWLGNRMTPIRRYMFRLHWRP